MTMLPSDALSRRPSYDHAAKTVYNNLLLIPLLVLVWLVTLFWIEGETFWIEKDIPVFWLCIWGLGLAGMLVYASYKLSVLVLSDVRRCKGRLTPHAERRRTTQQKRNTVAWYVRDTMNGLFFRELAVSRSLAAPTTLLTFHGSLWLDPGRF